MLDIQAKFWVGCHATYNDGYLFDKQYTATDAIEVDEAIVEAEKHFLKEIKKAKPEWNKVGYINDTYCEEMYMADYEVYIDDVFIKLDCGESFEGLRAFLDIANEDYNYPLALLIEIMKSNGSDYDDLQKIDQDSFIFEVDSKSHSDLSHGYLDMSGDLESMEGSDFLKQYFDHDSHGYDLAREFNVYDVNNTYYAVSNN